MTINKEMVTPWIIRGVIIVMVILALVTFSLIKIGNKECTALCQENNALTSQLLESGSFTAADSCICYFEEGIKTFVLA